MADAPAMPPDENRGPEILAVCGSLVGLALIVVALRIWVRAKMVRHMGSDDWAIIAAMVCTNVSCLCRALRGFAVVG
jgi:L-lactate permease